MGEEWLPLALTESALQYVSPTIRLSQPYDTKVSLIVSSDRLLHCHVIYNLLYVQGGYRSALCAGSRGLPPGVEAHAQATEGIAQHSPPDTCELGSTAGSLREQQHQLKNNNSSRDDQP